MPDSTATTARLGRVFHALALKRSADLAELDASEINVLVDHGVQVRRGRGYLADDVELLSETVVRGALSPATAAWLRDLDVRAHIGSTNSALLARAARRPIAGSVLAAEVQTAGRGRRGRTWLSPYGRNLAVSIGVAIERPVAQVGALSLVAGVALHRALRDHGLVDVTLKWPNDVLLGGRKLAGILIELVRAVPPVEVVIGIGVNVGCASRVADRIDQSIADVAEHIERPSRNELLARILDHVVAACRTFNAAGFGSFRRQWNGIHHYRGARVVVTRAEDAGGSRGGEAVVGDVLDVGMDGALRIETLAGIRSFTGGEVTVRPATAPEGARLGGRSGGADQTD